MHPEVVDAGEIAEHRFGSLQAALRRLGVGVPGQHQYVALAAQRFGQPQRGGAADDLVVGSDEAGVQGARQDATIHQNDRQAHAAHCRHRVTDPDGLHRADQQAIDTGICQCSDILGLARRIVASVPDLEALDLVPQCRGGVLDGMHQRDPPRIVDGRIGKTDAEAAVAAANGRAAEPDRQRRDAGFRQHRRSHDRRHALRPRRIRSGLGGKVAADEPGDSRTGRQRAAPHRKQALRGKN